MHTPSSLANHFLIAMPGLDDPHFSRSVTLLCHHTEDGAMGIQLNRPSDYLLGEIMAQVGIPAMDTALTSYPVLTGGPVSPERGFVLHSPDAGPFEATQAISEHIWLTTSRDILEAMAAGKGPRHAIIALGYAGWSPQQLESELQDHTWLAVGASPEILFSVPIEDRWQAATQLLGIHPDSLSSYSGHA